jgi:hypothetical protein
MMTGQCPTLLVKITIFVVQNVGEMGGYGIGIAAAGLCSTTTQK